MIYIGSDHGGYDLKQDIISFVKEELKQDIEDLGCFSRGSVDYPDIGRAVGEKAVAENQLGIVICGTGIGISIAANKVRGVRCALCSEEYSARMTRLHNNANVLALGGRTVGPELAKSIVKAFLETGFEGGRHERRVNMIMEIENS